MELYTAGTGNGQRAAIAVNESAFRARSMYSTWVKASKRLPTT
jgi:hypothetical protein